MNPLFRSVFAAACLIPACAASASLAATATITTSQSSGPYDYTITLRNTGTTKIGTFWFAWTDSPANYDFLPSIPTNISGPSGWTSPITHNGFPGDGYGIEWYSIGGSLIAPGGTATFKFTSNDSPQTLAGNAFLSNFKVTHSVVYIGFPFGDPGYHFDAAVTPAPGAGLVGTACVLGFGRRQRG